MSDHPLRTPRDVDVGERVKLGLGKPPSNLYNCVSTFCNSQGNGASVGKLNQTALRLIDLCAKGGEGYEGFKDPEDRAAFYSAVVRAFEAGAVEEDPENAILNYVTGAEISARNKR
ncbi:MAG: hypothetical protein OXR66_09220 [Candidatus Woesearchaeota archaeon]|nr:hypothetical protein [Candidatus Woesearchaeota archaeon]